MSSRSLSYRLIVFYYRAASLRKVVDMYKIIIPAILAIFALWILLQISLEMSIVKNPMNYFIVFIIFFLFVKMVKEKQQ